MSANYEFLQANFKIYIMMYRNKCAIKGFQSCLEDGEGENLQKKKVQVV